MVFSGVVSGDYEAARKRHSDNFAGGETLLPDTGNGLAAVADMKVDWDDAGRQRHRRSGAARALTWRGGRR